MLRSLFASLVALVVLSLSAATHAQLDPAHVGPGPLHKLLVPADDRDLERVRASESVVFEQDYGHRTLLILDERVADGADLLLELARHAHDEHDLIPVAGGILDGARPAQLVDALDPRERLPEWPQLDPTAGLYLVQFIGPVTDAWLSDLHATGARVVQHQPMNAFVVAARETAVVAAVQSLRDLPTVQHVGVWQPAFRIDPRLRAQLDSGAANLPTLVQLVDGRGAREALAQLRAVADGIGQTWRAAGYLNVEADLDPSLVRALARLPDVFWIQTRGTRARTDERQGVVSAGNVTAGGPSSPNYLSWLAGEGFNSSQFGSFSVNVVDDAYFLTGHPDLPNGRIDFSLNPSNQSGNVGGHGFLNAHIVAGFNDSTSGALNDSAGYNYGLGIAPWAHVGSTAIFGPSGGSSSSWESQAYNNGARISTNSWTYIDGSQNPIPDYDANAQTYDAIVRDARSSQGGNQEYMVLFSAGNDGPTSNTVSTPATAKNVLTVGAGENDRTTGTDGCAVPNSGANDVDDIISFSSQGPVDSSGGDGRWKPEIVSQGTHVQAGVPQSSYDGSSVCNQYWPGGQTLYGWSSGTSHSTPGVAGGAALVYQWFLNEGRPAPSPAMNKAVLVGTAEYMNGVLANDTLPSNVQGMGRMNFGRAFDGTQQLFTDQSDVLTGTGDSHLVNGVVGDSGEPFRVTLAWTDAPGSTSGAPWVNDLDLTVNVGGATYRGNVFSGATSVTGGSHDSRNNVESVFLPAGLSGAFTVTVDASSIAGDGVPGNGDGTDQDFALFIHNGSLTGGPVPPTANFSADVTSGVVPLGVNFSDQSTGTVDTWAWTFGDGGTSTQQNPSHTYSSTGTYTVSLTASGPAGSDGETKTGYITVNAAPPPGVSDGSFESQSSNSAPASPWSVTFGSGHVINPSGVSSDLGFPSDGTQWAELAADSTNNATPPSNPGGVTTPPSGGAGISQSFSYASGLTVLEFDASFLRNEDPNSQYNDWMSVDVSDGSTTYNVFYKDTTSTASATSSKYGYAATALEAVSADLAVLFPSSTTSTVFTMTAQVGNGTDDFQPSKGYIDDVRLTGTASAPVAEFSGTPTSGTAPLNVSFSDQSTGTVSGWAWTFGDGGTSTAQNPSHTYNSPGSYTVTLTASGPGGSDGETKTGYITVNEPAPVADFSGTPTSGTSPLNVSFSDLSTGAITSWSWNFGDGGASSAQNPSHTYTAAGTYNVTLSVIGPGGLDSELKSAYITVNEPAPVAEFSGTPTSGTSPLDVDFSDLSTGSVTSWSWTFGDGGTSSAQNPSHTYTSAGSYTVTLTATGPGGSDGEVKSAYITVNEPAPVAEFSGTPTSGTSPLDVDFTDLSSGGPVTSWSWTFGDGGTSTSQNPSHTYTSAGSYTVTLTATGPGGSDGESKSAYITVDEPAPIAEFSGTPTSGTLPLDVDFTDLSSGGPVTSWSWNFGDGGASTAQNPSHTYTAAGTYNVTLSVAGPGGLDAELKSAYITVDEPAPIADFSGTPTSGTSPLDVDFTDLSTGVVTSWSWTFGDGGTSTAQNPSHTYTTAGSYTVTLTTTGPGGSDGESKSAYITVAEPAPVADFSASPTSGTSPLDVDFSDLSSGGPITSWSWTFGDGGSSSAQNPSHTYTTHGTYSVTLTVTGPGGVDSISLTDLIDVDAPILPFEDLGNGLAGSAGLPLLVGSSSYVPGEDVSLVLSGALANRTTNLVIGISAINAPFKGGVLVPAPDILLGGLPTGPTGTLPIAFPWPSGVPSGFELFYQHWIQDAGTVFGFAASNAVKSVAP